MFLAFDYPKLSKVVDFYRIKTENYEPCTKYSNKITSTIDNMVNNCMQYIIN